VSGKKTSLGSKWYGAKPKPYHGNYASNYGTMKQTTRAYKRKKK